MMAAEQDGTPSTRSRGGVFVRRVTVGAALVGVVLAGNAAIGVADSSNGRDGTVPGTPTNVPAPAPADADTGRNGSTKQGTASTSSFSEAPAAAIVDNGRGGADPASGPLPIRAEAASFSQAPTGDIDTDSGIAPQRDAAAASASYTEAPSAPVDQDVPGAPTMSTPGPDTARTKPVDVDG